MIRAERLPDVAPPPVVTDPAVVEAYLEDASGSPPGRAAGVVRPASEAEAAAFLRGDPSCRVLPQAARSSLTSGAIPQGDVVLSVERLSAIETPVRVAGGGRVVAGAGVRLADLQRELEEHGLYYPPVPTHQEAMLGGTVSTNAGGAATFKYGVTRGWVHGLNVLLYNGDRLQLERGQALARPGETFTILLSDGTDLRVPVPDYTLPPLRKISAGYHAADPLDLVDLLVGSEGTLGLVTSVVVDVIARPAAVATGFLFLDDAGESLALASELRRTAAAARERGDPLGPDVRAIEWIDARGVDILRSFDDARRRRVALPATARAALLIEVELDEPTDGARAAELLSAFVDGDGSMPDRALTRLFRILDAHGALDRLELAFPGDTTRHRALAELREAVPVRVSELLAARRRSGCAVHKVAGDLIVPFDRLAEMIPIYEDGFGRRGLDYAVWGHLGDGNLHPNALPETAEDVRRAAEAQLEFADEAMRRGGCPLSEHGVGRSPMKQALLRRFLGEPAVEQMRRIKAALDPAWRFAPGVLFAPPAGGPDPRVS